MLMHRLLTLGAERHPDRPALHWVDRDRGLTYAEAVAAMERMAGALHDLGVVKGDRVSVFAHNGLDYLVAMLGAWRIGAVAALVNVKFADELTDYLADHTPTVVIYTHDMEAPVRAAMAAVPSIRHRLCMDGPQDGALSLPELLAAALPAPPDPGDETAIAHLSYTSGTTGRPKGACLAHEPTIRAARCIGERLRLRPHDVSFGPSALSSSYQLVANILPPLAVGASLNVMGRWTPETGYDALKARGATLLVANPPILDDVLREVRRRGALRALQLSVSGGGPVPPLLKAAWRDELGLPLVESYGQSELGGFVGLGYPELEPDDAKLGRVGPPLPDKEVRILGPDDRVLPAGEIGEITLTGGFMAGYWNRPGKTEEATRGGILRTGDLGLLDAEGCVTLRSRRAELVEVAGRLWYPRDVEEALMAQAGVALAALVGLPDPALGQRPVAFVTPAPGAALDPAALKAAIAGAVAYDLAALDVRLVPDMPMTPTGKIAKADLKARAA